MKSRNFLILSVPGLALLLLFSMSNVKTLASTSASAAPDTTLSGLMVEGDALVQTLVSVTPMFSVTVTPDPDTLAEPGGTVEFIIDISNQGGDEIFVVRIVDNVYGIIKPNADDPAPDPIVTDNSCLTLTSILGNGVAQCSFKAPVNGPPGDYVNEITVTAEDGEEAQADDAGSAMVTIEDVPSSIVTTLTAVPTSLPEPGGNVAFTIEVDNTSAVDTVNISVLTGDPPLGNLNGKGNCTVPQAITVGTSYQCSATRAVNGTPGQVKNVSVTATGTDDDGVAVENTSNTVQISITNVPSSIVTTLTAVPTSVSEPGGDVTFTVQVQNTSGTDMVEIESLIGDSPLGNLNSACNIPRTLAVGASFPCSVTREISGNSGDEKDITVIASGTDDDGTAVADSSPAVKITITDPDTKYVFLPFAVNSFIADEPNDTCSDAYPLIANTDQRFFPDDVNDWYKFSLSSPGSVVVALTNFVPVNDQIVVYGGGCGNLSVLKNNGNFSTTKIVDLGLRAAGTYHIRVITKDGKFSTQPYTLRVNVQ